MLKELISTLFQKQDPSQLIQDRLSLNWAPWLDPISEEKPTGEDPTYTDNFQLVKEEIGKLGGIDNRKIAAACETLLKTNSKDIRVAVYYCYARLKLDGLSGFIDGAELLAGLLFTFGNALYPSRGSVRKNSIEWLSSPKFIEPLSDVLPIAAPELERIIAALHLIETCNAALFAEDERPDLKGLCTLFSRTAAAPAPSPLEGTAAAPEMPPVRDEKRSDSRPMPTAMLSHREVLELTRRIAGFLREKPEGYLSSGRMIRSLRWDSVHLLPPADMQGRTRLPAPRLELKNHIQRLVQQQQWEEVIDKVEIAFMESANHFWLDLQRYAITAMQKRNTVFAKWADIFLTDVGLMLDRLPGLEHLKFDNGTPFADDDTLIWIRHCATIHHVDPDAAVPTVIPKATEVGNWQEIEQQALSLAQEESLENAVNWLQNLPGLGSLKQQFLLRYTQARVAERMGSKEAALALFQRLDEQGSGIPLCEWDSELWFEVKAQLLSLLKYKMQRKEGDKTALVKHTDRLYSELMQLNPARAIRLSLS